MTNDGSRAYTYDAENRMTSTAGVSYTYDGDGRRVKKHALSGAEGSNGTLYWYGVAGEVLLETDSAGNNPKEYVFFAGKRIARRESSGAIFYYFEDHLGSSRVVTQADGTVCYAADFYPYGGELVYVNNCPEKYKFTGKERDSETGLDYFGIRYYSFGLGRFLSPDSIANDWELGNPQTWNRYAYARNNPLIYVDPDGAKVEFFQGTEEERQRALEELKRKIANEKAAAQLQIKQVKEGDKTRYFLGITGDISKFAKAGAVAKDIIKLVLHHEVVEFGVTNADLGRWGGAATFEPGAIGNPNVRVLLNPAQVEAISEMQRGTYLERLKFAGQDRPPCWTIQRTTPGIALWHEFGHAYRMLQYYKINDPETRNEARRWENRMREQTYGPLGPQNAPRVIH